MKLDMENDCHVNLMLLPKDSYQAEVSFGELENYDVAVVYMIGDRNHIALDFNQADYYKVTDSKMFLNELAGFELGIYEVKKSSLVNDVYKSAAGLADHFKLNHFRIIAKNIVVDIVSDLTRDAIKIYQGYEGKV